MDGRRFWERHAAGYDRSMLLLGRPMPTMLARVREAARGAPRALELASGTGLVTVALAQEVGELLATDYADAMVAATRARVEAAGLANVRCEQRDLYALVEPDESFEVVVAANVLHLLPDLEGGLAAMRRVLKPGGALIVPTFCHGETRGSRLVSRLLSVVSFPAERRFALAGLRGTVADAGFEVERAESIPGPLPIGFVAARKR